MIMIAACFHNAPGKQYNKINTRRKNKKKKHKRKKPKSKRPMDNKKREKDLKNKQQGKKRDITSDGNLLLHLMMERVIRRRKEENEKNTGSKMRLSAKKRKK